MKKYSSLGFASVLGLCVALSPLSLTTAGAATHHPVTHHPKPTVVATTKLKFAGTYNGTMAMLWSDSSVKVTSISATGSGATLGLTSLKSGTGTSSPTSTCDPISGIGVLAGPTGTLVLALSSHSQGCAAGSAAPTLVTVNGAATIVRGTGKFLGARGTLAVRGTFSIKSTSTGSSESDNFSATLSGTLILKKK